jgi:hypothetical protein
MVVRRKWQYVEEVNYTFKDENSQQRLENTFLSFNLKLLDHTENLPAFTGCIRRRAGLWISKRNVKVTLK